MIRYMTCYLEPFRVLALSDVLRIGCIYLNAFEARLAEPMQISNISFLVSAKIENSHLNARGKCCSFLLEDSSQFIWDCHRVLLWGLCDHQSSTALEPIVDLLGADVLEPSAFLAWNALGAFFWFPRSSSGARHGCKWPLLPWCHILNLIRCLSDNHWHPYLIWQWTEMVFLTFDDLCQVKIRWRCLCSR